jgi:tRNA pseudouridine13 synthase
LAGDAAELQHRWLKITANGVPNYFGEQRFGRGGSNLTRAGDWFAGHEKIRDRQQRNLMLSAARSWLFNQVLARRVVAGTWNRMLAGDLAMLAGSHSVFAVVAVDAEIERRAAEFDVHPTGPLWGTGELRTTGAVRELEAAVAAEFADLCRGLEQAGMEQERRALRIALQQPELRWVAEAAVEVRFRLPAGAYATTVLRELVSLQS